MIIPKRSPPVYLFSTLRHQGKKSNQNLLDQFPIRMIDWFPSILKPSTITCSLFHQPCYFTHHSRETYKNKLPVFLSFYSFLLLPSTLIYFHPHFLPQFNSILNSICKMDHFHEAIGYGPSSNTSMQPRQLSGFAAADPAGPNDRILATWDLLKVQLSHFNQIVAIPFTWFRDWSVAEKQTILSLMM